ncbi:MAG: ankyrin repeat domain-containing protein [Planctomycetota bacterium]
MLPGYALIQSIKRGQLDEMMSAIAAGAKLNHCDFDGRTPLEVALDHGQMDLARKLVSLGADVNQTIGKRGDVLLHRAARTGNFGVMTLLLELGAKPEQFNTAGKTPLHEAVSRGYQFMADTLIASGASVDTPTPQGDRPIHIAARRGDLAMVKTLLKAKADPMETNHIGYTALHEASAAGQTETLRLLIDKAPLGDHRRSVILPRVRLAAELHGHDETAAAVLAAEGKTAMVAESPAR